MDIKDYLKKYGKQFFISTTYSKRKPLPKNTTKIPKKEEPETMAPHKPSLIIEETSRQKHNKTADYEKDFINCFKKLTYSYNSFNVWSDFVTMFACSISNSLDKEHFDNREKMYLQIIKKYKKDEQIIFPELAAIVIMALEENQEQDFLGGIYMKLGLGNKSTSQFFTPYHICQLMAEIIIGNITNEVKERGYISINDPCCGAGATLIAGINVAKRILEKENMNYQNHLLIVAQDIDFTVAAMCYIQLSLLGVAGYVKVGNSLTEPISKNDNTENYWFTPMYFSDIWKTRRMLQKLNSMLKEDSD